jgi:selenide,water dikinase
MQAILFDPQTSGGLLFAVDPTRAKAFRAAFAAANLPLAQIGEVIGGAGIDVAP